jgi:hypothetical protein
MSSTAASRSARCSATDLTSNQVWGLTKTDQEWSESLEAAPDGNPPRRPPSRHERRICAGMSVQ